jgi:hypothetical protein
MRVIRKYFPQVLPENEIAYFAHLEGVLSSVDEYCDLEVTRNPTSYHFRIVASLPKYNEMLLEEILRFHNMFKIRLDLSKSIKTSSSIVFDIHL